MRKTVLVIFGGSSTEHDISVITGVEALNAMPARGMRAVPVYIRGGKWYTGHGLYEIKNYIHFNPAKHTRVQLAGNMLYTLGRRDKLVPYIEADCALLATHGGEGENGALQGFLEINGVPYTSTDVRASAVCMDKALTKAVLSALGVRVVPGRALRADEAAGAVEELEREFGYPMMIKPAAQGSSIGISRANDRAALLEGIALAGHYGDTVLIERALLKFTELNNAAVSTEKGVLLSEIEKPLSASDFLTYDDKYMGGAKGMADSMREFPARVSAEIKEEILETTKTVYEMLGLHGVVRMDYLLEENVLYLNEINTVPGSLSHYLFPGQGQGALLKCLVDEALRRGLPKPPAFVTNVLASIELNGKKLK